MFLIGKLFLLLLRPLTWIIIIALIGIITKRPARRKTMLTIALSMLIFFTNPFFFHLFIKTYEPAPVQLREGERFPAGIVLGGFVSYNMKSNQAYFSAASDRFIETALLYKTGHIAKIIVSAGNGYVMKDDFQEAAFARDRLVELGIPPTDIFTDGLSRNTYENALFTKKICDSLHLQGTFLLVSSAIHLPRAARLFKKQGLDVRSYPCDFLAQGGANNFWEDYLVPSSFTLYGWDLLLKEVTGLMIYKLIGKA